MTGLMPDHANVQDSFRQDRSLVRQRQRQNRRKPATQSSEA